MKPYFADEQVTLYAGDCREITDWLGADVLVTDPPYGRGWRQGRLAAPRSADDSHRGIAGDLDTTARDDALRLWGDRPAIVFGDLMLAPPEGTKLVGVYRKPSNAGVRGAIGGYRRDAEAIYLLGSWPSGIGGRSSILATAARSQGGQAGLTGRYGHPHAKHGAGRSQGRRAIGVEVEERYCELITKRLSQTVLGFEDVS